MRATFRRSSIQLKTASSGGRRNPSQLRWTSTKLISKDREENSELRGRRADGDRPWASRSQSSASVTKQYNLVPAL